MEKPAANVVDFPYGPHPRNVLDLWQAESDGPAPLWVWIHGGGFMGGDKSLVTPAMVTTALAAGISVASINYRFSQQAPFPASYHDCARAIQFLRLMADPWNLDSERIATGGGSAGGGMSLWLGFHADLADASSDDPVARQSSRPTCMACIATQSSYDPHFIRSILPGPAADILALRLLFRVRPGDEDTPQARAMYAEASAIHHVDANARPVFLLYDQPDTPPSPELSEGHAIHHPIFGKVLKDKLDPLGVECVVRLREDYPDCPFEKIGEVFARDAVEFLKRQFGLA